MNTVCIPGACLVGILAVREGGSIPVALCPQSHLLHRHALPVISTWCREPTTTTHKFARLAIKIFSANTQASRKVTNSHIGASCVVEMSFVVLGGVAEPAFTCRTGAKGTVTSFPSFVATTSEGRLITYTVARARCRSSWATAYGGA